MIALGMFAMLACAAECVLDVSAYVRHMDSGDQAGFAMGMLFLITIGIPTTGALLAAGAVMEANEKRPAAMRWVITIVLLAGAAFFLACAGLYLRVELLPSVNRADATFRTLFYWTYLLTLVVFSIEIFGCALAVRSGSALPGEGKHPWFSWLLLATVPIAALQSIALIAGSGVGIVPFLIPSLVWIVVLLRSAWLLRRRDRAVAHLPR